MPNSNDNLNIARIKAVANVLGDLTHEVVFVGGCTTTLLVDKAGVGGVRYTKDVDFIVDIVTRADLYLFNEKLRERGFQEDNSSTAIICRWTLPYLGSKLIVDVMPVEAKLLGFTNKWYKDAFRCAQLYKLDDKTSINVITPSFFLATKFEVFHSRGKGDYFSHDLEDIVYLIEHRSQLAVELLQESIEVRRYLSEQAKQIQNPEFLNILPGLLDDQSAEPAVINTLKLIASDRLAP